MRILILAIAALIAAPSAASAQEMKWRVLVAQPSLTVMVSDVDGAPEQRELMTLAVLSQPVRGMDNESSFWTIDCVAQTVLNTDGTAFLGAVKVHNTRGQALSPQPASSTPMFGMIAAYACKGERVSTDTSVLDGDAAAVAYGKSLAAKQVGSEGK